MTDILRRLRTDVAQGTYELQQLLQTDDEDQVLSPESVGPILGAVIEQATVSRDASMAKPLLACLTLLLQRHPLNCVPYATGLVDAAVYSLQGSESELRQQALEMLIELLLGDLYDVEEGGELVGEVLFARLVSVCVVHPAWRVQLALCEFILLAAPRVWPVPPEEPSEPLQAEPLLRALPSLLSSAHAEVGAKAADAVECLCVHRSNASSILDALMRYGMSEDLLWSLRERIEGGGIVSAVRPPSPSRGPSQQFAAPPLPPQAQQSQAQQSQSPVQMQMQMQAQQRRQQQQQQQFERAAEVESQDESIMTPHDERELESELTEMVEMIETIDKPWSDRKDACEQIASLVKEHAQWSGITQLIRKLQIKGALVVQFADLRSAIVRASCDAAGDIAEALGQRFEPFAMHIALAATKLTAQGDRSIMSTSGHRVIERIVLCTDFGFWRMAKSIAEAVKAAKQDKLRANCADFMALLLQCWDTAVLEKAKGELTAAVKSAICDSAASAREAGRAAFWKFERHFPEVASRLGDSLPQSTFRRMQEGKNDRDLVAASSVDVTNARRTSPRSRVGSSDRGAPSRQQQRGGTGRRGRGSGGPPSSQPTRSRPSPQASVRQSMVGAEEEQLWAAEQQQQQQQQSMSGAAMGPSVRLTGASQRGRASSGGAARRSAEGASGGTRSGMGGAVRVRAKQVKQGKQRKQGRGPAAAARGDRSSASGSARGRAGNVSAARDAATEEVDVVELMAAATKGKDWLARVNACRGLDELFTSSAIRQRTMVKANIEKLVRSFESIVTDQHPKVVQAGIRALEALIRGYHVQMESQLEWTLPRVFGKTMAPKPQTRSCAQSLLECVRQTFSADAIVPALGKVLGSKNQKVKLACLELLLTTIPLTTTCFSNAGSNTQTHMRVFVERVSALATGRNMQVKKKAVTALLALMDLDEENFMRAFLLLPSSVAPAATGVLDVPVGKLYGVSMATKLAAFARAGGGMSKRSQQRGRSKVKEQMRYPGSPEQLDILQQQEQEQRRGGGNPGPSLARPNMSRGRSAGAAPPATTRASPAAAARTAHRDRAIAPQSRNTGGDELDYMDSLASGGGVPSTLESQTSIDALPGVLRTLERSSGAGVEERRESLHYCIDLLRSAKEGRGTAMLAELWDQFFVQMLLAVTESMKSPSDTLRELALRLLQGMVASAPSRFADFIEIVLVRLIDGSDDTSKDVRHRALQVLEDLMTNFPTEATHAERCFDVLVPVLNRPDRRKLQAAVRAVGKLAQSVPADILWPQLRNVMPPLLRAIDHESADVRKVVVFCLVELHLQLGREFDGEYLSSLSTAQYKLVSIYVDRARKG